MNHTEYAEKQRERRERIATQFMAAMLVDAVLPSGSEDVVMSRLAVKACIGADALMTALNAGAPQPEVTSR